MVRLDDSIKLQKEFLQFEKQRYCNREHVKTVNNLITEAYYEKARTIKLNLNQKQILSVFFYFFFNFLKNIGKAVDQQLNETIESLGDLLPNYSKEQLHVS